LGRIKIKIINKTTKYLIVAFFFAICGCDKDISGENCLCIISLRGNFWSQYNVSDCNSCNAPQGYTAKCDCE